MYKLFTDKSEVFECDIKINRVLEACFLFSLRISTGGGASFPVAAKFQKAYVNHIRGKKL